MSASDKLPFTFRTALGGILFFALLILGSLRLAKSSEANAKELSSPTILTEPAQMIAEQIQHTPTIVPSVGKCSVSSNFPQKILQWCDLISAYAEKFEINPNLVAAVIWQESGGNPQAYSASGAVGLMQVMPSDGLAASFLCMNGPCFANRPTMDQLYDPEFNIKYGTRMISNLLKKYGSVREALKNYGPGEVGYYYADKVLGLFNQYGGQK